MRQLLIFSGNDHENDSHGFGIERLIIRNAVFADAERHTGLVPVLENDMRSRDSVSDSGAHQAFPVENRPFQIIAVAVITLFCDPVNQRIENLRFGAAPVKDHDPAGGKQIAENDCFRHVFFTHNPNSKW